MIKNLMIVDDSTTDQMVYDRLIMRSGQVENVFSFDVPSDALSFLRDSDCPTINALLLDVNMPETNGFEFLEQISPLELTPLSECVIYLLTTSLNPAFMEQADSHPSVTDCLLKPLVSSHLEQIVEDVGLRSDILRAG